jgi:hypothetical protein
MFEAPECDAIEVLDFDDVAGLPAAFEAAFGVAGTRVTDLPAWTADGRLRDLAADVITMLEAARGFDGFFAAVKPVEEIRVERERIDVTADLEILLTVGPLLRGAGRLAGFLATEDPLSFRSSTRLHNAAPTPVCAGPHARSVAPQV